MPMRLSDVKSVRPVRSRRRLEKWLVKYLEVKFVLRSITECAIVSPALLRDHV